MHLRHTFAAVLLIALTGCASLAPDDTGVRDAVSKAIADEDAARDALPRTIRQPVVFANEYAAFATQGWALWSSWLKARRQFEAETGVSYIKTTALGIRQINLRGRRASVVVDETVTYTQRGRIVREHGVEAFSLNGFGAPWRVEGMARLNAGAIARGPDANAALGSARAFIQSLNIERVVPAQLVDSVVIEDDLQDWQRAGPEGDVQDPHRAPLMPGDPDMEIVLGEPLGLGIGPSDAFVVFSATLRSKSTGQIKGRGRLGLTLGKANMYALGPPWAFEAIAWAPL